MVSNRLRPHPAWQHNRDMLTATGVTFIDITTGHASQPAAVQSGADITAACNPAWVLPPPGQPAQRSKPTALTHTPVRAVPRCALSLLASRFLVSRNRTSARGGAQQWLVTPSTHSWVSSSDLAPPVVMNVGPGCQWRGCGLRLVAN